MQKTTDSKNIVTSMRLPQPTRNQIDALAAAWNVSIANVITIAIDRMYQQEIKNMTTQQQIAEMLTKVYEPSEIAAATIERKRSDAGYGWHIRFFGRNDSIYMGASVAEVADFITEVRSERE